MRNPAARAASGILSPSSQAAWCGSPQAICTTSTPSWPSSFFSSGTLFTCSDQLQTPIANGSMDISELARLGIWRKVPGLRQQITLLHTDEVVDIQDVYRGSADRSLPHQPWSLP